MSPIWLCIACKFSVVGVNRSKAWLSSKEIKIATKCEKIAQIQKLLFFIHLVQCLSFEYPHLSLLEYKDFYNIKILMISILFVPLFFVLTKYLAIQTKKIQTLLFDFKTNFYSFEFNNMHHRSYQTVIKNRFWVPPTPRVSYGYPIAHSP